MNQWQLSSFVTAHDCCRKMYGNTNAVCDILINTTLSTTESQPEIEKQECHVNLLI